jgi:hypothetical protein
VNRDQVIAYLDEEIAELQEFRRRLKSGGSGVPYPSKVATVRAAKAKGKRNISPEARAKMAAAQKRRWAKFRKAAK